MLGAAFAPLRDGLALTPVPLLPGAGDEILDNPTADGDHSRVGLLGATGLVAGGMVGSAVFVLPATLAGVGSISMLGWIAALAAALVMAGVFMWLGPLAPEARGIEGYVRAGMGRFVGVQATVLYWVASVVGLVAVAVAVSGAVAFLVPVAAPPGPRLLTTLAAIWLAVAISSAGPRLLVRFEGWTLLLGLAPVALVATVGWFWFKPDVFAGSWNPKGLSTGAALSSSGIGAFWAFLGLESAAAAAASVKDPARNVPRATLFGVCGAAALYMSASAVLMGMMPATALAKSMAPFADVLQGLMGVGVAAVMAVCMALRAQGCLTGFTYILAETSRTAADDGEFIDLFRTPPGGRRSYINLLTGGGAMSLVAIATASPTLAGQYSMLANVSVVMTLYAYGLAAASLWNLARGLGRVRMWIARLTSAVAIIAALALAASAKPVELLIFLVTVALAAGLDVWLQRRHRLKAEH